MFRCPGCNTALRCIRGTEGRFWRCPDCKGRLASDLHIRTNLDAALVKQLWDEAHPSERHPSHRCPACRKAMVSTTPPGSPDLPELELCKSCRMIWFDPLEFHELPKLEPSASETDQVENKKRLATLREQKASAPANAWWHYLPGIMGMPIEVNDPPVTRGPIVTWTIAILCILATGFSYVFGIDDIAWSFGFIPAFPFDNYGTTFLTSFLLHGSPMHLAGNLYFLMVFGNNVEDYLGRLRYVLLITVGAVTGDILHMLFDPNDTAPLIGASGGISAIIVFYGLKFPHIQVKYLIFFFFWLRITAGMMMLFWLGTQLVGFFAQIGGYTQVSSLAHLGGALIGLLYTMTMRKS